MGFAGVGNNTREDESEDIISRFEDAWSPDRLEEGETVRYTGDSKGTLEEGETYEVGSLWRDVSFLGRLLNEDEALYQLRDDDEYRDIAGKAFRGNLERVEK